MSSDPLELLRSSLINNALSGVSLDPSGQTISISTQTFPTSQPITLTTSSSSDTSSDKQSLTYPLGSVVLLLLYPGEGVLKYRSRCKEASVETVKVTDKKDILGYFGITEESSEDAAAPSAAAAGEAAAAASSDTPSKDADGNEEDKKELTEEEKRAAKKAEARKQHELKKRQKKAKEEALKKKKEAEEAKIKEARAKKKEKAKTGMTNEELMSGLDVVADKRDGMEGGDEEAGEGGKVTGDDDAAAAGASAASAEEASGSATPGLNAEVDPEEEEERKQHAAIMACLSSAGYEVRDRADVIEADRAAVERITAHEIPVGNSASVLRCGAGAGDAKRDFTRVLDLYMETVKGPDRGRKDGKGRSSSGGDRKRSSSGDGRWGSSSKDSAKRSKSGSPVPPPRPKPTGPPIIVVPNAMTSPITLLNASDFFGSAAYVPRDEALKRAGSHAAQFRKRNASVSVRHRVAARLGGGEIEFEVIDNPATRLTRSADWDRVVAVIAQGAEWQFKSWRYNKPVDLFGRCFGFYIGIEGAPVPQELQGWNVKIGKLNRDKRGLDSVTYASFWNGLSEWMHVHKPEFLKLREE